MPVYNGANALCRQIRAAGGELWICTTRPYLKLDSQSPNTQHWLRRNKIQYDHMLSGPNKYRDLVKSVGIERIVTVLDDLPEMYDQATSLGIMPWLRDQPYNRHRSDAYRVLDLKAALATILTQLVLWRKEHESSFRVPMR